MVGLRNEDFVLCARFQNFDSFFPRAVIENSLFQNNYFLFFLSWEAQFSQVPSNFVLTNVFK